jgi:CheY-like chemotaxis protein
VVDDNATNRRVLSRQIAPHGVSVACAEGGPQALLMLRAAREGGDPFDAAVIDMQMPGMDGLQLARAVKGEPAISEVRLVLLTSMGKRGDDAEEVRRVGIEGYLTKPARQHELRDALATVMGRDADSATKLGDAPLVTRNVLHEARAQSRGHVLVAEDNPVNQMVALKMLERLGYRVDVVANGAEAGPDHRPVHSGEARWRGMGRIYRGRGEHLFRPAARKTRGTRLNARPLVILMAEDDPGHASLVRRNLRRAGVVNEVVRVEDGQETLDYIGRKGRTPAATPSGR